jgi:hypothetical protein
MDRKKVGLSAQTGLEMASAQWADRIMRRIDGMFGIRLGADNDVLQ